jgi:putative ABC transport system permease protein
MQAPTLLLRASGEARTWAGIIGQETKELIPSLPAPAIHTMDELLSETVAQARLQTHALSLFAGIALVLAAVGLYGVIAYAVTQRTREIGVRMALGAQKGAVLALVIGQGMKLAVLGVALGLAAALALTRVLRNLLYGIPPNDPATFAAVSVLLLAVALLACWLPARRASRIDPMEALRHE